jgi:hypothetical protein
MGNRGWLTTTAAGKSDRKVEGAKANVRALVEAARALPESVKEEGENGNEEGYAKLE